MSVKTEEVHYCDLCNGLTDGFYYYEVTNSALGVISETRLGFDICRQCAKKVQWDIPADAMIDRYDDTVDVLSTKRKNEIISQLKGFI